MKYTRPRGTQDILPPESDTWRRVESVFEDTFAAFGYQSIRTPIFESTDLFVRAVGEGSDIVTREMYTFEDRGGRSVTLRPENTASVIRAYLENGLHRRGGVQRLCYIGPMFRYDRPQAGRYRQFHQAGAEAIGSASPAVDVEMIQLVVTAMKALGFERPDVRLNSVGTEASRGPYRKKLLVAIRAHGAEMDADALARYELNPLRIFDSKDYGDRLKEHLPLVSDYLVGDDAEHFTAVQRLLSATGVKFTHDPHLVRGLDYYTRTVFEVYHGSRGAQSALCGGGRYDNLVADCGGPDTPAMGFSAGLERIVEAMPESARASAPAPGAYVVCGEGATDLALRAAAILRPMIRTETDLSDRSVKKQIQSGEKTGARFLLVAQTNAKGIEVRDLAKRDSTKISEHELAGFIRNRLENAS